ncbi:MAG TPA: DUF2905 domain-containing protein [bacterium]|nr:DUF2905 domain-containing protein [bacterium]HMW31965.1 DUF2905 domain-containing protein [bacterium]HMW36808.1 DUF2905 domain-containing protein [bacterium]HMY36048.1 DUF2905 domain-containing protein [bacterium]HMZ04781.1 DUF2905 domain-containing protein [bacterium]
MEPFHDFGKTLMILGGVLIAVGMFLTFSDKIPLIGRLPGDIFIQRENFSFYFPITSGILLSVILSVLFWLFRSKY